MILPIETLGGTGGVAITDIHAILPDTKKPNERSMLYTGLFPEGLSVDGLASELCALWYIYLEELLSASVVEDEEEDEDVSVAVST